MESFGPRGSFGKMANVKTVVASPPQSACHLGVHILQETFRVHDSARSEIVDRLLNNIVTRATAPVSQYLGIYH